MAAFAQFYPWLQLECPNVPPKLLDDAILRAARCFCEDTFALELVVTVPLVAATASYTPTLVSGTELATVLEARIGTTDVPAVLPRDFRALSANNNVAQQQPYAYAVVETDPFTIGVFPTPDTSYSLSVVVATKPSVAATAVDDLLFSRYREPVIHYALYALMSQVGQTWSNPDGAVYHHAEYTKSASKVRTLRYQGMAQIETSVQMRPFA